MRRLVTADCRRRRRRRHLPRLGRQNRQEHARQQVDEAGVDIAIIILFEICKKPKNNDNIKALSLSAEPPPPRRRRRRKHRSNYNGALHF